MSGNLPDFGNPPVVETVIGLQFAPIEQWNIAHFGLFWRHIRDVFPKCETHPELGSIVEEYPLTPQAAVPQVQIELQKSPPARCWYTSVDDREVVQIQRDRFIYNWRKVQLDQTYPRYETFVRPAFQKWWEAFQAFLEEEGLGKLKVVQCEVTYLNHIARGEGWDSIADCGEVFTIFERAQKKEFLPPPETVSFGLNYPMPEHVGRLRVHVEYAVRQVDAREVLVFRLTARGKPQSSQGTDILHWIDLGREWVVRGFTDLTSPRMHSLWQRSS